MEQMEQKAKRECVICSAVIDVGNVCDDCYETELYENPKKFGEFIGKLRRKYGWSRKYLSNKLGFNSESSVMNFEIGHTIMKVKHVSRFCKLTPTNLTVTVLYAMFEASSIRPPCRCVCHYDMNNIIPSIYHEDSGCRLCGHGESDCVIINGLWFEKSPDGDEDVEHPDTQYSDYP